MAIHDNQELYSVVLDLCKSLKELGANGLAADLQGALSVSSLPGEVLGEIGLSLKRVRDHEAYRRLEVRRRVDDGIAYVERALGL
jgi:hypothetical protein